MHELYSLVKGKKHDKHLHVEDARHEQVLALRDIERAIWRGVDAKEALERYGVKKGKK